MTAGNQDREFRSSPFIYPNPRDSRIVEANPDYHAPIYFLGGEFYWDAKGEKPCDLEEVPEYILARIQEETLPDVPARRPVTLGAPDFGSGNVGAQSVLKDLSAANAK